MDKAVRPLGVTIIATLQIIGAIFSAVVVIVVPLYIYNQDIGHLLDDPIMSLSLAYLVIMIPISLLLAIGLLKGVNIARVITMLLHVISIITAFLSFNVLSILISIVIIHYLTRQHVKEFFYGIQSSRYY